MTISNAKGLTSPVLSEVTAPNSGHTLYFVDGKLVHPQVYARLYEQQRRRALSSSEVQL